MTTLPQTSPMRLPRPASSHLAIPTSGVMGPAQPAAPAGNSLTAQDVWRVIRANLWLIVGMLVVSGVGGFLLNQWLLTHYPRYTSTILISVRPVQDIPYVGSEDQGINVHEAAPQSTELEQLSQAGMLTNKYFLGSIIDDPTSEVRKTNWFKQFNGHFEEAKEDLQSKLEVYPKPNTRLISVSMSTGSPADSLTIVREIVDRHVKERTDKVLALQYQQSRNLSELIGQTDSAIRQLKQQIAQQADIMARFGASGGNYQLNGPTVKLTALVHSRAQAEKDLMEAKAKLDGFVSEVKAGGTPLLLSEFLNKQNQASSSSSVDQLETALAGAEVKWGRNSPQYQMLQKQLDEEKRHTEEHNGRNRDELINGIVSDLTNKVAIAQKVLEKIEEDYAKANDELKDESRAEIALNGYKKQLDTLQAQLDKQYQQKRVLETTINAARDPNNALSTASVVGGGDLPDKATFPRRSITMSVSIVIGLALALGIAFLREFTDTSVRSPRDIAKVGQLNLLGMIPHESEDPEAQNARLPLAIYEAPTSIIAEQFRQVRTRLQHSASLDTVRSLMVTGTAPGDGKTTVACNLAAGLALNGRRILLVDANFRRPQVHAVLNIPNDVGFGDVLNSLDMFESAVRETEIPNLSVLPTGVKPANSTELLESQLLIDFIERALEEYDHVIFDSGPLLLVSETSALAPRVDGVVTVVRARGNSRGMLQRLRDQLRQLKAENLGVVLNAVRAQTGGYYAPMIKSYYAYQQND
jgi:polysaccharide biosynthesis transport protein